MAAKPPGIAGYPDAAVQAGVAPLDAAPAPWVASPPRYTVPASGGTPLVVSFVDVVKRFGKEVVLHGLNFSVPPGQVLGIIGPSGSGKSTTVRLMLGMYRPSSGSVTLFGQDPSRLKRIDRERVGYMPQDFVLYPTLTAEETLRFAASLYGVPWKQAARRSRELLQFVDLAEAHNRRAGDLSGGMRRRLSLAATLVHDPDFLVLDEPTAGIDPILRVTIWEGLKQARDSGKTLVVTTQYITEAEYCDNVLLVYEGMIIAAGTPDQLRHAATGGDMLDVRLRQAIEPEVADRLRNLPFVVAVEGRQRPDELRVTIHNLTNDLPLLAAFFDLEAGGHAEMEPYVPSFEDVFVRLVNHARAVQEGTSDGHASTNSAPHITF